MDLYVDVCYTWIYSILGVFQGKLQKPTGFTFPDEGKHMVSLGKKMEEFGALGGNRPEGSRRWNKRWEKPSNGTDVVCKSTRGWLINHIDPGWRLAFGLKYRWLSVPWMRRFQNGWLSREAVKYGRSSTRLVEDALKWRKPATCSLHMSNFWKAVYFRWWGWDETDQLR